MTHMAQKVVRPCMNGIQTIYRFNNGYGASIVQHSFSYGTEMAIVRFYGSDMDDFHISYDSGITDDVLGYLSPADIDHYLDLIERLPTT